MPPHWILSIIISTCIQCQIELAWVVPDGARHAHVHAILNVFDDAILSRMQGDRPGARRPALKQIKHMHEFECVRRSKIVPTVAHMVMKSPLAVHP